MIFTYYKRKCVKCHERKDIKGGTCSRYAPFVCRECLVKKP